MLVNHLKLRSTTVLATSSLVALALVMSMFALTGCGSSHSSTADSGSTNAPDEPNSATDHPLSDPNPSVDPCLDPLGPAGSTAAAYRISVCKLVNQAREANGLPPLTLDLKVSQVSQDYAVRMVTEGFFDHTAPDGSTPSDRIKAGGITFTSMGENIARGQKTPEQVFNAWWNSTGHKANMMSPNYKRLGVGFHSNNWVQNFVN